MRAALAVFCLLAVAVPARADCVSDCQSSTYCGGSSYECAQLQSACYRRECGSGNATPARVSGAYGAIAYGEDSGAYGLADPAQDKAAARKSALGYCRKYGDDCEIVDTFKNTCAAVAQQPDGAVAWSTDDDRRTAGTDAVKQCNKKAGKDNACHITLLHCYAE